MPHVQMLQAWSAPASRSHRPCRTHTRSHRGAYRTAALEPAAPDDNRVLLVEVGRIAGAGGAAVVHLYRRHDDFPDPVGGTEVHPEFEFRAVVDWFLAHDKIEVPATLPVASLLVAGTGGGKLPFRLEDPWLDLADDADGEDRLTAWTTDDDADALAEFAASEYGVSVSRLTAPGASPLAVSGEVRVIDRYRAGAGGLRITLAWPARLRGAASPRPTGGQVRHGLPYAAPGPECVCWRHDCGGLTPATWCAEHGRAAEPAMEWHPADGVRCTQLAPEHREPTLR
ncbi:hypothetical protein ABZ135_37080 [Streptomyces sp. NPDC006339]|uniref:hypothetical protein n=1 Tax=Streptomyces sp. NPDC006339 TaxID=3156755 RepID=UPI0033A76B90